MYLCFLMSSLTLSLSGIAVPAAKKRNAYSLRAHLPDRCDLRHEAVHIDINVVLGFQSTRNMTFIVFKKNKQERKITVWSKKQSTIAAIILTY